MNENLNLVKILYGCPVETVFYSSIFGDVKFVGINSGVYPITMKTCKGDLVYLTKDGKFLHDYIGECTLFPSKDQRDWSKFERFWDRKFDLNTLEPFDKVLVRNRKTEIWLTDMFTFHIDEPVAKCITGAYMQCIPYNEETKHLLGTTNDCPEYFKWWEE